MRMSGMGSSGELVPTEAAVFGFRLYVADRSDEQIAALHRVADELADGDVGEADGGGFAEARVNAPDQVSAEARLRGAIDRAAAQDSVDID
jgi:hypothetical protein